MTTEARDELIRRVIEREGGVADVGDGKGVTRWGQTPDWLEEFSLPTPTNAAEAAQNYATWLERTGLDAVIGDTADPAADFLIDFAVHSSHRPAVKLLQAAVDVVPDGVIGPKTRAALASVDRRRLAVLVIAGEIKFQGELITRNPAKYARWAKGWANRNAAKVLQLG